MLERGEVELDHGEGLRRRKERHFGAALAAAVADDLQRRHRDAVGELHEMFFAVAPDGELEPARQRVDHRDADAVQAAGHLVGVLVEFSAGVQLGHDDLGRRHAFALWMSVGMPRPLSITVTEPSGVERDHHLVGEAGERLVDGVVDHLVDHVVQAGAVVGVADIHARPLAHGVEALEDLDRFRVVVAVVGRDISGRFSHRREPQNGRKNESNLSFGVTRNLGLVQGKVTAVNMLIQNAFFKEPTAQKTARFLSPLGGRIRRHCQAIRKPAFCSRRTAMACVQIRPLAHRRGLASKHSVSKD